MCKGLLSLGSLALFSEWVAFIMQGILEACAADIQAVKERDPACKTYSHCFLNFKGFQAIQAYRVSHNLWLEKREV